MDQWTDGWMNGWTDGSMNEWTDGSKVDKCVIFLSFIVVVSLTS